MTKRTAILFYGQIRVDPENNLNLASLNRYFDGDLHGKADVFMHLWTQPRDHPYFNVSSWAAHEYLNKTADEEYILLNYKPKKYKFEEQRYFVPEEFLHEWTLTNLHYPSYWNVSNMLSQIYSISAVCNLITDKQEEKEYEKFILMRLDSELQESFPQVFFDQQQTPMMYTLQDFIQVFKHDILEIYKKQFANLKLVKYDTRDYFDAEALRGYLIGKETQIVNLDYHSCKLIRRG